MTATVTRLPVVALFCWCCDAPVRQATAREAAGIPAVWPDVRDACLFCGPAGRARRAASGQQPTCGCPAT